MDQKHSSCWDSILEKVKPHLPTIDFDSSSSEDEGALTIYQRPAELPLAVLEDFDDFSLDDDALQELSKPAAQTWWSGETCSHSEMLEDDGNAQVTTATQLCLQQSDTDAEADASMIGIRKLDVSLKPNVNSTRSKTVPVLSFARLDQWDLDEVLQNLRKDQMSLKKQDLPFEPAETDSYRDSLHEEIMQRLVAFCNSQLSKSAPEPVKNPNNIRQNNVWNKSSATKEELQQTRQECPTVYIDLRYPNPPIKPQRVSSNLSPESTSPTKHNNTHQKTPAPVKKPNLKAHTGSQTGHREVTGKSMLLQKIREMKRTGDKYPKKYTDTESTCSPESHHLREIQQNSPVQSEDKNTKTEVPTRTQQNSVKQLKRQCDHQKHEQHQQILKELNTHRPTKSVNKKQPAAETTDVLYDSEASHLQSVSPLPADITSEACMLLIVNLSSPGMIGDRRHGRRRHLYPAATKSHIYNTLVAWFLSLVGPDPCHIEDQAGAKVPFWVAGLQQLWTEDGLALHALAVARHSHTAGKRDSHAAFYNQVHRFLSDTSLTVIAKQACASSIPFPSLCLNSFISAASNRKVLERAFVVSPGFYWATVETPEQVCKGRETTQELHTEVSVALGHKTFFQQAPLVHSTLQLIHDSGLDVCGLRLFYLPQGILSDSTGAVPVLQGSTDTCEPFLALAVRGPRAYSVLKDLTSSLDPLLFRKRGPLKPIHCGSQEPPLCYFPSAQVHRQLCLWFSGRVPGGSMQNGDQPLSRPQEAVRNNLFSLSTAPSFLCATTKADLLLVVSPVVPPCCYSQVLALCERRGFSLRGLQRLQLQSNGAALLGLTNQQALLFCSAHTETLDQETLQLPSHCLVLLLRKENAIHHSISLPAALMREFKAQRLLGHIQCGLDGAVEPSHCFHTVCYSSNLFNTFVRCMWAVPEPSIGILSNQKCSSTLNMEQVVILTLCGKDMSQGLSLLHRALTEGLELLGLKHLPALTQLQAQELSPYEVGEQRYRHSLDILMSSPALVCALKQQDAFASLGKLLAHNDPGNLCVLMSPTPEMAFRQASLFFFQQDMIPGPQVLLTLCLFKLSIWNHSLAAIASKLRRSGLVLVGLRVLTLDKTSATSLLPAESDPSDVEACVEYWCSGPSLALCLRGQNAVRRHLDVLGTEDSSLLTTRYRTALCNNGIYASASYGKAIQDVKRFFSKGLCCTETSTMRQEQIRSMSSDPLASVEREQRCTVAPLAQESLTPSRTSGPNEGSLIHSALWQTTCLLIPLNTLPLSRVPCQFVMLTQLLRSGCHLVAGRMSILDNEQRQHIAGILDVSSSGNERMAHLSTTPCLIMALQGETVVTCFEFILQSIYKDRSDLEKLGRTIIYPESVKEARQLICYLFDALSPESYHAIIPQSLNRSICGTFPKENPQS